MTLKPMRGAAVAAELAVVARVPAWDCPQPLAAFAGPCRDERELAGMSGPAADRRLPASSTPSAVFAEVARAVRVSSVITAAVAPDPCLGDRPGPSSARPPHWQPPAPGRNSLES